MDDPPVYLFKIFVKKQNDVLIALKRTKNYETNFVYNSNVCKIEKIKHTKSIAFLDENSIAINKMNVKGFEILYKTRRTDEICCKKIEMNVTEKALSGEAPERAEKLFNRMDSAL